MRCIIVLVFFLFGGVVAQAAASQILVSKSVEGIYVQTFTTPDRGLKSVMAQAKQRKLVRALKQAFRPLRATDTRRFITASCVVVLREWEVGDPHFQMECWSDPMWEGDHSFVYQNLPDTPEEVLTAIDDFIKNHVARLKRLRPQPIPAPAWRAKALPHMT